MKISSCCFLSISPQKTGRFSRKGLPMSCQPSLIFPSVFPRWPYFVIFLKAAFSKLTRAETTDASIRHQTDLAEQQLGGCQCSSASVEAKEQLKYIKSSDTLGPRSLQQHHPSFLKVFQQRHEDLSHNSKPWDQDNLSNVFHTLLVFHRDVRAKSVMDG